MAGHSLISHCKKEAGSPSESEAGAVAVEDGGFDDIEEGEEELSFRKTERIAASVALSPVDSNTMVDDEEEEEEEEEESADDVADCGC